MFPVKRYITVTWLWYTLLLHRATDNVNGAEYILNAAVMVYPDDDLPNHLELIAQTVQGEERDYCSIRFTTLTYNTTDGSSVYESLKAARKTFENASMAVAVGSQIDVFTSTDYVIMNQAHLVTSSDEAIEPGDRVIPILPDPKSLSIAIVKTIKEFGWTKVAFLAQDDFSPVLALGAEDIFVWPIRLPNRIQSGSDVELQQTLTTLREAQMEHFILHSMKKNVVTAVIKAAQRQHLLHHTISWFLTYLDFKDITDTLDEMATMYGFQLLETEKIPEAVIHKYNGTNMPRLNLALMFDVVGVLRHYFTSKIDDCKKEPNSDELTDAGKFLRSLKTEINGYDGALGMYEWPSANGISSSGNVRSQYKINILRYVHELQDVGKFIFSKEPKTNLLDAQKPETTEDAFRGKEFDVMVKLDDPFVMRSGSDYVGFCIDVLKELSARLNFNYNLMEVPDSESKSAFQQWDEIINTLRVGNASIAIGAMAVTAEREEKISFSYTIISSAVSLLLKRPPDTRNYFQFLWPFSTTLWLMIVVFFVVVGVSLYLMYRFDTTQDKSEHKFDLKESMWYSLNVLLQGSTEFSPETTSTRTIIAFFWFCTLVINAAYTANLAAYLTLQQIDNRIKTVENLAMQTDVSYGVLNNSDLMHFFEDSRNDPYERMWAYMKVKGQLLPNRTVGLQKVLAGSYAYLDDGVINNYISQGNCETESIEQNFGFKHFSMGFPKGAPYRDDINRALLQLKERGVLDQLRAKWWSPAVNCTGSVERSSSKTKTASELGLTNMFGVFIVLIAATILAILYEIGYVFYKLYRRSQQKKISKENNTATAIGNFQTSGQPQPDAV